MKKAFILLYCAATVLLLADGLALAGDRCTCEDWDKDGRFGVVLNGRVLKGNVGNYDECMRYARALDKCPAAEPAVPSLKCTCEDWDKDGRFGVVLNGNVLKSNVGNYKDCMRYAGTVDKCRVDQPAVSSLKCTCEDWDKDGRFGVVLNGRVLKGNVGNQQDCLRYAATLGKCRP